MDIPTILGFIILGFALTCAVIGLFACMRSSQISNSPGEIKRLKELEREQDR